MLSKDTKKCSKPVGFLTFPHSLLNNYMSLSVWPTLEMQSLNFELPINQIL